MSYTKAFGSQFKFCMSCATVHGSQGGGGGGEAGEGRRPAGSAPPPGSRRCRPPADRAGTSDGLCPRGPSPIAHSVTHARFTVIRNDDSARVDGDTLNVQFPTCWSLGPVTHCSSKRSLADDDRSRKQAHIRSFPGQVVPLCGSRELQVGIDTLQLQRHEVLRHEGAVTQSPEKVKAALEETRAAVAAELAAAKAHMQAVSDAQRREYAARQVPDRKSVV